MTKSNFINDQSNKTLERASLKSEEIIERTEAAIGAFSKDRNLPFDDMCFAVVGSVGRHEALEASDLDLIPIAASDVALEAYRAVDQELRSYLKASLDLKVSKGEDLTSPTSISNLADPKRIGGELDSSSDLTKRVLILTESRQCGGGFEIEEVRQQLLREYGKQKRTSGRHYLTLCNDVARYYKTLCIEYKGKIDGEELEWGMRNIKLRHSRKMWYFSMICSMSHLAELHPKGDDAFRNALSIHLAMSPVDRVLAIAEPSQMTTLGKLLSSYAFFLEFMSSRENREALNKVDHDNRYQTALTNPFPVMKFNSDLLHERILNFIEEAGPARRSRILSWFML